ncbi:hypothetical protein EI42_06172 [Thermosporothrix hazakensis]|jgi:hypothetical protein|uniref:Uncharacterized protein n=1 Tax=Thermosporothrix hazakensis TaxID=644383 RepID=A0A326U249_THEHA|nr:hypothetical protein [Thermosporothrix hazakensis]PZW19234.1 hypothetical protein EI42_06172 [Thermosporothrix hazakensis]GCE45160.1 hypothetical protein KTH_00290 [Thermosporothrix hazakensis]
MPNKYKSKDNGYIPFDRDCLKTTVAIRAIWLLWRRGRWAELGYLGLTSEDIKEFVSFDLERVTGEGGRLRGDRQARALVAYVAPATRERLLSAAHTLNRAYVGLYLAEVADVQAG